MTRGEARFPCLSRHDDIAWGNVAITGTRVTVHAIVDRFIAGDSLSEIMHDYAPDQASMQAYEDCLRLALCAARKRMSIESYWRSTRNV